MARSVYYVSIGSRTVQDSMPDTDYLRVEADDAELERLQELLARLETVDEASHLAAAVPYKSNDHARPSGDYDRNLLDVYGFVYQIGTEETKRFIEGLDFFHKLGATDYNHPGYTR